MLDILQSIYLILTGPSTTEEGYKYLPFHGTLLPVILLLIAYVAFVFRIGPWLMRNREPYKLTSVLRYYNIIQIIFNTVMAYLGIYLYFYNRPVSISCMTILPSEHPLKSVEIIASFSYLANKFVDLLDTIFFVLRKSYKQVTFLHVYHHILMTSIPYIYLQTIGTGGQAGLTAIMNAIVHTIMYGYYFVSATKPNLKKSLWWKKYITQIQIIQFVLAFIHNSWPLIVNTDCAVSKIFCVFSVMQAAIMIYLFGSFYKKNYLQAKKSAEKSAEKSK